MAVVRVFGRVDGVEVILEHLEGDIWQVPVPSDQDGEYVVEILAEDGAGNRAYLANLFYSVNAGNICIHMLPVSRYLFESVPPAIRFLRTYPVCEGVLF